MENKERIQLGFVKLSKDRIKLFYNKGGKFLELYLNMDVEDPDLGRTAELWLNPGESDAMPSFLADLLSMAIEDKMNFPKETDI